MNICMFSPFTRNAPSAYRILSFARVLAKSGHNITVVLPIYDRYTGFKIIHNENIDKINFLNPFQFKTKQLSLNMGPYILSSAIDSVGKKFDVIHVLKPTPLTFSGYIPKFLRGIPLVQDIDDLDHVVMMAEKHSRINTWIMMQCERIIPKFADKIVVSCSPLKQLYEELGMLKKVHQIPNGVFVKDFETKPDYTIKLRYSLREKVVIYVGSLNNEFQLHPLLYAMQKVVTQKKNVSCLIVGDGTAKRSLEQLTKYLGLNGHVTFTGRVPHSMVSRFLSVSDLGFACFPKLDYLKYASNIKIFEYMAAGVPAIVNSAGDLPYYVDYGKAGVIVDSGAEILSGAIIDILSDEKKYRKLVNHAKVYVKNFDWAVLTQKLSTVYNNIVFS